MSPEWTQSCYLPSYCCFRWKDEEDLSVFCPKLECLEAGCDKTGITEMVWFRQEHLRHFQEWMKGDSVNQLADSFTFHWCLYHKKTCASGVIDFKEGHWKSGIGFVYMLYVCSLAWNLFISCNKIGQEIIPETDDIKKLLSISKQWSRFSLTLKMNLMVSKISVRSLPQLRKSKTKSLMPLNTRDQERVFVRSCDDCSDKHLHSRTTKQGDIGFEVRTCLSIRQPLWLWLGPRNESNNVILKLIILLLLREKSSRRWLKHNLLQRFLGIKNH